VLAAPPTPRSLEQCTQCIFVYSWSYLSTCEATTALQELRSRIKDHMCTYVKRLQVLLRPHAGQHEEVWRADGPGRENHLLRGKYSSLSPVLNDFHSDGAFLLNYYLEKNTIKSKTQKLTFKCISYYKLGNVCVCVSVCPAIRFHSSQRIFSKFGGNFLWVMTRSVGYICCVCTPRAHVRMQCACSAHVLTACACYIPTTMYTI
jgi:hypothetical protein